MLSKKCRGCCGVGFSTLIDLGTSPISNEFLDESNLHKSEKNHNLEVVICNTCGFAQLSEDIDPRDLFKSDYVYFSSYSKSWLTHAQNFASFAVKEFGLSNESRVVEIASNDGYLLQYFKVLGISVIGIEPTLETATAAINNHEIETIQKFFNSELALELISADRSASLLIGNNVLAHVPDIRDFIRAVSIILQKNGRATFEFPHLVNLLMNNQFDTIYHEHYSYLSLTSLLPIFQFHGLDIYKVEQLPTHGGSIRIYVARSEDLQSVDVSVAQILDLESKWDPRNVSVRENFQRAVTEVKELLLKEILSLNKLGVQIVAYGAAAKGNTLLNYCGIDSSMIDCVVDSNPNKQGKYLPGSQIPVVSLKQVTELPGVFLILPWNLQEEIISVLREDFEDCRYLVAIPKVAYVDF
jgi:2-polyprenyl-3-methyl-5-hydroxy-6-metoxy-1,4-benzoquinol methylase